tara:strand:+ start:6310 stop:6810 length:501 start_codon:yes stop_codon:yes gene_type:complete
MTTYEPGTYLCRVTGQGMTKSGSKGTPCFVLHFYPLNMRGVPVDAEDRTCYTYLTSKTVSFTVDNLRALGFTGDRVSTLDPSHPEAQVFAGQDVEMYVTHEEYEGELKERWHISTGSKYESLEKKEMRQLDNLFSSAFKQNRAPSKKSAPPPPAESEAPADDEIPF